MWKFHHGNMSILGAQNAIGASCLDGKHIPTAPRLLIAFLLCAWQVFFYSSLDCLSVLVGWAPRAKPRSINLNWAGSHWRVLALASSLRGQLVTVSCQFSNSFLHFCCCPAVLEWAAIGPAALCSASLHTTFHLLTEQLLLLDPSTFFR